MKRFIAVLSFVGALGLAGCVPVPEPAPTPPAPDMPTPASKHCVDQDGKLEIRDEAGGQAGYCVYPDGSEYDEWAFFRGECAPGGAKTKWSMRSRLHSEGRVVS
jgi:hypothetical protein